MGLLNAMVKTVSKKKREEMMLHMMPQMIEGIDINELNNSWKIPDTRDLKQMWKDESVVNSPAITILYLCNAQGGYEITKDEQQLPMSVMMPMGLSVYETRDGKTEIAHMNIGMMANFFTGVTKTSRLINMENATQSVAVVLFERADINQYLSVF